MGETMTGRGVAAVTSRSRAGASGPAAGELPPFRGPSYLVVLGGVLVILRLPVVGGLGALVGMVLVLVGTSMAFERATDPSARHRLAQAVGLAMVVTALTALPGLLTLLDLGPVPGGPVPAWASVVPIAHLGLGILGTGLLTVALTRETSARGWEAAADAWWAATVAIVVVHGPILAAAVLVQILGRSGGVHGPRGVALFAVALTPLLLIGRAGGHGAPTHAGSGGVPDAA
jgi:hypothetical protein